MNGVNGARERSGAPAFYIPLDTIGFPITHCLWWVFTHALY